MQRDKRHIHAEKLNRLCQHVQRDIADVGALHVDDALVGAQAPCQLTVADVHCIDLDRAVLQHTIGKAAGGRTNVHTDLAVRRQRKALHCLFQFEAAAADIADVMAAHLDLGSSFIISPALSTFCSLTKTTPAMMRLWHAHGSGSCRAAPDIGPNEFSKCFLSFRVCFPHGLGQMCGIQTGRLFDLRHRRMRQTQLPHGTVDVPACQPASCRARARCSPMPPQATHSSAIRTTG